MYNHDQSIYKAIKFALIPLAFITLVGVALFSSYVSPKTEKEFTVEDIRPVEGLFGTIVAYDIKTTDGEYTRINNTSETAFVKPGDTVKEVLDGFNVEYTINEKRVYGPEKPE